MLQRIFHRLRLASFLAPAARIRAVVAIPAVTQTLYLLDSILVPLIGLSGYAYYTNSFFSITILKPVPLFIGFVLWLQLVKPKAPVQKQFSMIFLTISLLSFVLAPSLLTDDVDTFLFIGTVYGFLVRMKWQEFLLLTARNVKITFVAAHLGLSFYIYYAFLYMLWQWMCDSLSQLVYLLMKLFGTSPIISITGNYDGSYIINMSTPDFSIMLFPQCSGIEGISMFIFLMFFMMLIDWRLFEKMSLVKLYLGGLVYMYLMNVLRIAVYFLLGCWSYSLDAGDFARSLRGATLFMFHSWAGFVFYLIAFYIFASQMYKVAMRRENVLAARSPLL